MFGRLLLLVLAIPTLGCGGDSAGPTPPPPPPPPPVPVARVSISPGSASLVPNQTWQLMATALDASGSPLAGRTITWTSSATGTATVSNTGLVQARSAGSAVITAASEGASGSATIAVGEGGYVGSAGGTITSTDGLVTLLLPQGAVPGGVALTIVPVQPPPAPPAGTTVVPGSTYAFGPDGTHFGTPVTVTIKYNSSALPAWVVPGDLVLLRWNGTQWSTLTETTVDPVRHTVTGKTPGFSSVGVYFRNPVVTITPRPAHVNAVQRSAQLGVEISGEGRNPDAIRIDWTNTAAHGKLTAVSGRTVQYTVLSPILPAGDLDVVGVKVSGQFEPGGPFELLGEAYTTVRSDLDLTYRLLPPQAVVQYGGAMQFKVQVVDRNGNVSYDNATGLRYDWAATSTSGSFSLGTARTTVGKGNYTAKPASQQSAVRPKGDKIAVTVWLVTFTKTPFTLGGGFKLDSTVVKQASLEAFVQVIPPYKVKLVPESADLQAGQSKSFQVAFDPAWQEDEQLFYRWTTTGSQGTLSVTQGAPVTQGSVSYRANESAPGGTDYVDVEVLVGTIGVLGSARASVSVEARSDTVQGAYFQGPVFPADDANRSCVGAWIQFPLVAGARRYEMYAHEFNDYAYWHTSIRQTITPPLPALSGFTSFRSGTHGGNYYFFLTAGCGPDPIDVGQMNARFTGMKVDVTVKY